MAWETNSTYLTTDPPIVLADVLQYIANDIRAWGGNVDAGGYSLVNCTGVTGITGSNPLTFKTNSTERMRIVAGGSVGIGTTSPERLLDVGPSADSQVRVGGYGGVSGDQSGGAMFGENIYRDSAGAYRAYVTHGSLGGGGIIVTSGSISLVTYTGASTAGSTVSPTAKLSITAAGLVSITNLPTYASNAAAISGGLSAKMLYTDGAGAVKVVF